MTGVEHFYAFRRRLQKNQIVSNGGFICTKRLWASHLPSGTVYRYEPILHQIIDNFLRRSSSPGPFLQEEIKRRYRLSVKADSFVVAHLQAFFFKEKAANTNVSLFETLKKVPHSRLDIKFYYFFLSKGTTGNLLHVKRNFYSISILFSQQETF